jgi:hypothetical protein
MATTSVDEAAKVRPIPPRYWWLKRIILGVVVLFVALLALRLWWGWEAHRRFRAEIDKLIAAGEPIFPEDFNPKEPIPDEENAAKLYLKAGSILNLTDVERTFLGDEVYGSETLSVMEMAHARVLFEKYSEALDLIRQARDLPLVDWGHRFSSPVWIDSFTDHFRGQRNIARMLAAKTAYHHAVDSPLEVVEILRDFYYHAQSIDKAPPLIDHLVAIVCFEWQYEAVERFAPSAKEIRLAEFRHQDGAALRGALTKLKDELQNESIFRESLQHHMRCDAMNAIDWASQFGRGAISWTEARGFISPNSKSTDLVRAANFPITPIGWTDGRTALMLRSRYLEAALASNLASAMRILGEAWQEMLFGPLLNPVTSWCMSGEIVFRVVFRNLAVRRMAATALAIRLYEVDHGRRPETLDELVPDYLSAVPLDPLAEGDRPIGYLPHAERPILYSVGEDGIDHGGRYEVFDDGSVGRRKLDWPFFLDGPRGRQGPSDLNYDAPGGEADQQD